MGNTKINIKETEYESKSVANTEFLDHHLSFPKKEKSRSLKMDSKVGGYSHYFHKSPPNKEKIHTKKAQNDIFHKKRIFFTALFSVPEEKQEISRFWEEALERLAELLRKIQGS